HPGSVLPGLDRSAGGGRLAVNGLKADRAVLDQIAVVFDGPRDVAHGRAAAAGEKQGGEEEAGQPKGSRAAHGVSRVGWVERSEAHREVCCKRWASLRSTHSTEINSRR